jgi:pyruvate kinase
MYFELQGNNDHAEVNRSIVKELRRWHKAKDGDKFIITKGDLTGVEGGTNALKVIVIGQGLTP